MDFTKLLGPYSENNRTVEGQIAWLKKQGYSEYVIEEAITSLYNELDAGRIFQDGHELDQRLREIANEFDKIGYLLLAERAKKSCQELAFLIKNPEKQKSSFLKRLWSRLTEPI